MTHRTKVAVATCALLVALPVGTASADEAFEFTPTIEFALSDTKVGANPELTIKVAQDSGEEELAHVTLVVPPGFNVPPDKKIPNGEDLGTADITIDSGPRCAGGGPVSAPATFPDRRIFEQDRNDEQVDARVRAVWVVDLRPVTTIPLTVTGNRKKGFKFDGDIPANAFTCPPFTFEATIFAQSAVTKVPIILNPKPKCATCTYRTGPGDYQFSATFSSADSPAVITIPQIIAITE